MTAFDKLEERALNLTLGSSQDPGEAVVVMGLFTSTPPETHDGKYGQNGEPVAGGAYKRARATFGPSAVVSGSRQSTNTQPITLTGLPPGTYTHFGIFGSNT